MKGQLLINEISLGIATIFLVASIFNKNIYVILLAFIMIGYSSNKIKKLKRNSNE